jgi:ssDNA-binding Zn-finger/Zn-ribbon topoisomerase 1
MSVIIYRSIYKVGDKCPACNGDRTGKGGLIVKKWSKNRAFAGCSRYPECKFASKEIVLTQIEKDKKLGLKKSNRRRKKIEIDSNKYANITIRPYCYHNYYLCLRSFNRCGFR